MGRFCISCLLVLWLLLSAGPAHGQPAPAKVDYRNASLPTAKRVDDLLARMTLEEKVAQMMCLWSAKKQFTDGKGKFDPAKAPGWFKVGITNGELDGVKPKVIVVMAGINNIGARLPADGEGAKAGEIVDGLKAILEVCQEKAPGAVVILMGVTPRNDNPNAKAVIDNVNAELERMADGKTVRYLNINDKLADKDGRLLDGMSPDRLHLSVKGYQVWANGLKPVLKELLGPPAMDDLAPPPTGDPKAAGKTPALLKK